MSSNKDAFMDYLHFAKRPEGLPLLVPNVSGDLETRCSSNAQLISCQAENQFLVLPGEIFCRFDNGAGQLCSNRVQ